MAAWRPVGSGDGSTPRAPDRLFASDNASGVHPAVMDALVAANAGHALAYGADPWTRRATERFRDLLGVEVAVAFAWGGTGANVVGLQCLLAPWEAVICPDTAHIAVDECGAPERFTGCKLLAVPTDDGRLLPADVEGQLHLLGDEHHVQPRVVSITESTEFGTLYSVDEIAALADLAHGHGLLVHLDGARIANAVAALDVDLRALVVDTGVDVMTFGGTKNGMMYGEAVVFLRPEHATHARFVRKQAAAAAVEDAVRVGAVRGPPRRRPVDPQRAPRERDGRPARGRDGRRSRASTSSGRPRSTRSSPGSRRRRSARCRTGRSSGCGTRPSRWCGGCAASTRRRPTSTASRQASPRSSPPTPERRARVRAGRGPRRAGP